MQKRISIDGYDKVQPTTFEPQWETTYTEDSGRSMSGKGYIDPMFTAEAYSYGIENISKEDAKEILQIIVPRPSKPTFELYYYSWFYGEWRTGKFYVGKGSMKCITLEEDKERCDISCSMIGVEPL